MKELPCPFCCESVFLDTFHSDYGEMLGLYTPSKLLINKILFNWVAPLTFFSHVDPLKGSILLGTEEIVHVKNCNPAPVCVPAGNCALCFFLLQHCFWITHLSSFLVKATQGSFRAGRKNTQIQPGVGVLALGFFVFGNEMSSVPAVNCSPSETWIGNGL